MSQLQLAKLLFALQSLEPLLQLLEELIEEVAIPSCAKYGHACHHCSECDPGEHV